MVSGWLLTLDMLLGPSSASTINSITRPKLNMSALVVSTGITSALLPIMWMKPSGDLNPIVPTGEMW